MTFIEKAIGYLQDKEGYTLSDNEKQRLEIYKQAAIWVRTHGLSEAMTMLESDKTYLIGRSEGM